MKNDPKAGQKVKWDSSGGEAHGKVVKKITTPTTIKSNKITASKDNPQFIVETGSGKQAAHKATTLKKD